jgi:hypothetical protein
MRYLVVSESSDDEPGERIPIVATSDERLIGAFVDLLTRRLGGPRPLRPSLAPLPRAPGPPTGRDSG